MRISNTGKNKLTDITVNYKHKEGRYESAVTRKPLPFSGIVQPHQEPVTFYSWNICDVLPEPTPDNSNNYYLGDFNTYDITVKWRNKSYLYSFTILGDAPVINTSEFYRYKGKNYSSSEDFIQVISKDVELDKD